MSVYRRVLKIIINSSTSNYPFNFRITSNHNCHHRQDLWYQRHQHISIYASSSSAAATLWHSPSMSSTKQNFLNKKSLHCTTMTYQQIHSGKSLITLHLSSLQVRRGPWQGLLCPCLWHLASQQSRHVSMCS